MKPLTEEEIIFLGPLDEQYNSCKGVTVKRFYTRNEREETRIAIWHIVKRDGSYFTCKSGGVSLNVCEFQNLTANLDQIRERVSKCEEGSLKAALNNIHTKSGLRLLKEKIEQLENLFCRDPISDKRAGREDDEDSVFTSEVDEDDADDADDDDDDDEGFINASESIIKRKKGKKGLQPCNSLMMRQLR